MGQLFLIVIDSHSKWMEMYPSSSICATATIELLRRALSLMGCLTCYFQTIALDSRVKNLATSTAPRHPSSNGLVERSVRTFKDGMKRLEGSEGTVHTKLSRFVLAYRSTPQTTTGVTPAELLFNRCLRIRLDLIRPDVGPCLEAQQSSQKERKALEENP